MGQYFLTKIAPLRLQRNLIFLYFFCQNVDPSKGGTVDLMKNDNGIAHVVLNHPERRNALSGNLINQIKCHNMI